MSTAARGVLFAGVLLAVVSGAVVVADTGSGPTPAVDGEPEAVFTGENMAATVPTEDGSVSLSADASGKTIAIDAAHGNAPSREQLAPVVSTLTENGAEVTFTSSQRSGNFNATLRNADAFVVFGADERYTTGQLAAIESFTDAGGRLLVLTEPEKQTFGGLFFPPRGESALETPLTPLLSEYGVGVRDGYLFNMADYDNNFVNVYGTPAGESELTAGVDELVFHESVALVGGESVVTSGDQTTLSTTRESDTYGVVTRAGENAVVVGDTSVLGSEFVQRSDNEVFTSNLLTYLVTGEKSPADAPQPSDSAGPRRA
ncbi:hypothetical protein BRD20_03265 [Halobacteriales archaeon SW_8_65_20]|nr:MAG: hypothetical protein BRD20_03265 [Halobacteriales archaeon SW_8_65_20]